MDAVEKLVHDLCYWVVRNADQESGFLTPDPQHSVNATALMDYLVARTGIPKETIAGWVGLAADLKEKGLLE